MEISSMQYRDPHATTDKRVADLIARLSPEEKVGQISAVTLPVDGLLAAERLQRPPGIVVVRPTRWEDAATRVTALQEQLTGSGTRWGIPALVVALRDLSGPIRFPSPIARAATWDQGLLEEIAAATAMQNRAGGASAQRGPSLALALGPFPAAVTERDLCFGGEPLLAADLITAHVRGAQGPVPGRIRTGGMAVAVTQLGAVVSQLTGSRALDHHERVMRSTVLVPAEAAVRAGAAIAVPAMTSNAGVPAHADTWLLREVLRHEWGFDGPVIAADDGVDQLVGEHRVATDLDDAHALALEAGIDVLGRDDMVPRRSARLLRLVREGAVPAWIVDDAVAAVLRLKVMLGLFDDAGPIDAGGRIGGPAHRHLARRATVDSLVLLADPGSILPLHDAGPIDVLCVDAAGVPDTLALAEALGTAIPGHPVRDSGGAGADPAALDDLADTVVVVVPGDPRAAVNAVSRLAAGGRRCVVLVCSGDVDGAPELASTAAAVLLCWGPLGDQAGAVADVLAGAAEPGGRLPFALGGLAPLPLGHGRGYASFEYSQLLVAPARTAGIEPVVVQFRLTNTGTRPGKEVVQVYLHDHVSSVRRPSRMLVGFATIRLEPGRSRQVRIPIPPDRLAIWNRTLRRVVEPGEFDVLVGRSAADIRLTGTFVAGAEASVVRLPAAQAAARVPLPRSATP